eukprot:5836791-Amphidinium_carterae.1
MIQNHLNYTNCQQRPQLLVVEIPSESYYKRVFSWTFVRPHVPPCPWHCARRYRVHDATTKND